VIPRTNWFANILSLEHSASGQVALGKPFARLIYSIDDDVGGRGRMHIARDWGLGTNDGLSHGPGALALGLALSSEPLRYTLSIDLDMGFP
jgi:hypothetical protein